MTSYTSTARKIYALLTPGERKRGAALLGLMMVGMTLETLGIGLIIPAIALLVQSDPGAAYPSLRPLLARFGNPTQVQVVTGGMLAMIAIYVIKAMFLAFLSWYQNRFAFGVQEQISQRLFSTYLRQPYTFHLQRNSAELIRNAVNEVHQLWFFVLNPVTVALSEGLVLLGVTCLLMFVEPVGALIVLIVLSAAAWAFHHHTRARLVRWGVARQHHDGLRIQQLQQGLGGAKEVKLLGREDEFLAKYRAHNAESARVGMLQATLQQLPRLWIELLAVSGLAVLVVAMLAQGRSAGEVVPTLGLFAAAAFRLMPSVYRMLGAVQNLPYGMPVIDTLQRELQLFIPDPMPAAAGPRSAFQHQIELERIDYTYPDAAAPALNEVSLSIRKGECVGLVGPSGSGKSTLVDVMLGLLTPSAGRVIVDGKDIQLNLRAWQSQIGYVAQNVYLTDDTITANVAFGIPIHLVDHAAVMRAIRAAQLDVFVASLPDGLDTFVGERGVRLSGGQRQRIGIARAVYHDPAVLVLDEATSALDTVTERGVMQAVAALQGTTTVLIVAHRLSTVSQCSRLYRLDRGTVTAEGAPAELLQQQQIV